MMPSSKGKCSKQQKKSIAVLKRSRTKKKKKLFAKVVLLTQPISSTSSVKAEVVVSEVAAKKKKKKNKPSSEPTKKKNKAEAAKDQEGVAASSSSSGVYVLELQDGCVYVGKSSNIQRRVQQHMDSKKKGSSSGRTPFFCRFVFCESFPATQKGIDVAKKCRGASFTRLHRPTGRLLKRLGTLNDSSSSGGGDGPERDETLRWMHKLGPDKVRGWKFVRRGKLTAGELREIEANIRELFDLCRTCGEKGHFARQCPQRDQGKKKRKQLAWAMAAKEEVARRCPQQKDA